MAVIKLGAIVTDIAGSVGGTTFRRGPTFISMTNKSNGPSKNAIAFNRALAQNITVIKAWGDLSQSVQNQWNTQAQNFQFPDKFGSLRNITGRQLYIKLQTTRIWAFGSGNVDPFLINSDIREVADVSLVLESTGNTVTTGDLEIVIDPGGLINTYVIGVQLVGKGAFTFNLPKFRKLTTRAIASSGSGPIVASIANNINAQLGGAGVGQRVNVAVIPVNEYGFRGTPFFDTSTVAAP